MTAERPDRWERIKEIFGAALDRDPSARTAYLDEACAGDAQVRHEVDALLAAHQASDTFLQSPAANISPSPTPVHAAFADGETVGTYSILRTLGRGGMATVYLAQDLKHHRRVALKVLHPELAHALGPDRFLREIEVAANLSHPHILPLFDSGKADGHLYYVMPYVEGESLRDRLQRETQLPVDDALQIAREVADALAFAHGHGIVHRDIKPENILLSGGHALVADFGIARALGQADGERLTKTGMAVGTAAYMSPEQAQGEARIDGRTDIYSLGCMLFEMLAGEPPFTGPTVQAIIAKRFTDAVPRVSRLRPSVPDAVDQAVARALTVLPADRFATAAEFSGALSSPLSAASRPTRPPRWTPSVALVFAFGLAALSGVLWRARGHGSSPNGPTRLAVLPFENIGNPDDDYFADGMADAIRGKLTDLPGVQVIARTSSITYKKSGKSPRQIGQELGVQYILAGTVRWERGSGGTNRVQVSPELIQVSTESARWQQAFDAVLKNVFDVQADIASLVAQSLDLQLGPGERKTLAERPTRNLAAYDAYLRGEKVINGMSVTDPNTLRQGQGFYEQATALDSGFVLAWVQLSRVHSFLYFNRAPDPADADAARLGAQRALDLAPGRGEPRLAFGDYYALVARDNAKAMEEYRQGQRLAPSNADLLTAPTLAAELALGQWDSAHAHLQRAFILDPRSAFTARQLGFVSLWLRRYPEAWTSQERARALAPDNIGILQNAAMVRLAQGDLVGARGVIGTAHQHVDSTALASWLATSWDMYWVLDEAHQRLLLALQPGFWDNDRGAWGTVLAQTYWLRGDRLKARTYAEAARLALQQQINAAPQDAQRHVFLGLMLAYLGRKAEAIREGERGVMLDPMSEDHFFGPYIQHQLVRIYLVVNEPEKALDNLEPLLTVPYYLSPGWLKIDPNFDPLRGNPRFQRLVAGKS